MHTQFHISCVQTHLERGVCVQSSLINFRSVTFGCKQNSNTINDVKLHMVSTTKNSSYPATFFAQHGDITNMKICQSFEYVSHHTLFAGWNTKLFHNSSTTWRLFKGHQTYLVYHGFSPWRMMNCLTKGAPNTLWGSGQTGTQNPPQNKGAVNIRVTKLLLLVQKSQTTTWNASKCCKS